ncbi:MAG: TetR/AcrR family transcriptional regulator [Bacteroidetes bacterium]|nr:MAG: TetR/AcrR family transcriptional regulator [Bacteroidota bacterium]
MIMEDIDIRNRIIKVAQGIFKRFGFKKSTMDEIAVAAGKGKSTLYYYFKSKDEVFAAVVEKEGNTMFRELNKIITANIDSKLKIKKYIIKRMEMINELSNLYLAIKSDYLNHFGFIQKYRVKYDEYEILLLEQILQDGINKKEFNINEEETKMYAYGLATALKGLEIPFFLENRYSEISNRLDSMLNIIIYGLACKKTEG